MIQILLSCTTGMFLSVLAVLGSSSFVNLRSLELVRTKFTNIRVPMGSKEPGAVHLASIDSVWRDCEIEQGGAFLLAGASVHVEGTHFRGARLGADLKYEGDIFTSSEEESLIRVKSADNNLLVTGCTFTGIKIPTATGTCILCQPVNDFQLINTKFTECTGQWGIVYVKSASLTLEEFTLDNCQGTESLCHFEHQSSNTDVQSVDLPGCKFLNCEVTSGNLQSGGAGLVFRGSPTLSMYGCTFSQCRKSSSSGRGGGCFGTWITRLTKLLLQDCYFNSEATVDGGCFYINMALDLEADNCTFEGAKAARGGVFFFSNQRGDDYYNYTPGKVRSIELRNCTIRNCEANQGAVMYFHYVDGETVLPAEVPTLVIENTTINGCKASSRAFWLDVSVSTSFTFENNTISNMGTDEAPGSIRLSVPSSSLEEKVVVFSRCNFLNTNTPGFVVQFTGTAPGGLKLDDCRLVGVTVSKPLNLLQENGNAVPFTFTNCWLEKVTRDSGELLKVSEGDVKMTGCTFDSCTGSFDFGFVWTVSMTSCEIRKMSGELFKGDPNDVTLQDVKVLEPTGNLWATLAVGETFSAKLCELTNVALTVRNCRTVIMENVTMSGGSGSLTLYGERAASTIKYSDFSTGFTLSGAAVFTFEDCCFGKGKSHYITKGGQDASTLKLVGPMCFDKAKEDAISGWETVEGLEDSTFGDCECRAIGPPEPEDPTTSDDVPDPDPEPSSSDEAPGGDGDGKGDSKGLAPGEVAAIVVVVIAVVAVAVVLIVLFVLRRRKTVKTDNSENEVCDDETINTVTSIELDACVTDEPGTTSPMFLAPHEDEFGNIFEEAGLY